uniref:GRF-type domain-containing protein n=1 Tax=Brassica campestris TaxID=3711 RepID=M4FAC7_BRACM
MMSSGCEDSSVNTMGIRGIPEQCGCGRRTGIYTSKTKVNPGRTFFRCPTFQNLVRIEELPIVMVELVRIDLVKIEELPMLMLELVRIDFVRFELLRIELVTRQSVVPATYK